MKDVFSLVLMIIASFILFMTSCMSDVPKAYPDPEMNHGERLSINVDMPQEEWENNARVAYDDATLKLTWEEGDQLRLVGFDAEGNFKGITDFTLSGPTGNTHAQFSGISVSGATQYDIYYPVQAVDEQGELVFTYNGQKQLSSENTRHLNNHILLKSERVSSSDLRLTSKDIDLSMQSSIIKFILNNIPNDFLSKIKSLTSLTWEVESPTGATKSIVLDLNNYELGFNRSYIAFISFTDMDIEAGGTTRIHLKGKGPSLFPECSYELKLNYPIKYQPNYRYFSEIDFANDATASDRIYYESEIEFTPGMFSPAPINSGYDPSTGKGFLDFNKAFLTGNSRKVTLKNNAFQGQTALTSIELPEGISSIGNDVFDGCTQLKSIKIPSTVKKVYNNTFNGCSALEQVIFANGIQEIEANTFQGHRNLKQVQLPSTIDAINDGTFAGCQLLESIVIPEGVTSIGRSAFQGCSSLTEATIPSTVTTIKDMAFSRCESLTKITLPANTTSLEADVFYQCTQLKELHILAATPPIIDIRWHKVQPIDPESPIGLDKQGLRIYIPKGSLGKYTHKAGLLEKENAWIKYKNNFIEE